VAEEEEEEEEEVYGQKGGGQMMEGPAQEGVWMRGEVGGGRMIFWRWNGSIGANKKRRWRRRGMGKSKNHWPLREPILVREHILHSKRVR
jgi:hypothetical protein